MTAPEIFESEITTPPNVWVDTDDDGNPIPGHWHDMSRTRTQTFSMKCPRCNYLHELVATMAEQVVAWDELYEQARSESRRRLLAEDCDYFARGTK